MTHSTHTSLTRVGVIGCGDISAQYLETLSKYEAVSATTLSDLDESKARVVSERWSIDRVLSPDDLFADPDIDIVLNLTVPRAHYEVAMKAVEHGKHVYNEKPLAENHEQGQALLKAAKQAGGRMGCAQDTVMGQSWQFARRLLDAGEIGEIVGGVMNMQNAGMEMWHPNPRFFYSRGGGPVMDMGPYFIHAIVMMLGPVVSVTALSRKSFNERVVTSQPNSGMIIPVEVDTHCAAILELGTGAFITMMMSFDCQGTQMPDVEIYGTESSLGIHTPNNFVVRPDGSENIYTKGKADHDWVTREPKGGAIVNGRGMGLADMSQAIIENRPHRASGEMALHALEVMVSIERSSNERRTVEIESTVDRPDPLPDGWSF